MEAVCRYVSRAASGDTLPMMHAEVLTHERREHGKADLLRFTALNALSFEVLAGQILILFARQVGASLAEIGLLAALLPFASVIQLGVAPLVNRFGPRALMLAGWGARTVVSGALFLVPLVQARGGPQAGTHLLLAVMAAFYLCRALGMSSWLPIIQEIVEPPDRGSYLSRQEWVRQASILLINIVTAIYLLGANGLDHFLHVIGLGVIAASWSLYFLWRVPDVGSMAEPLDREYFRRALAPLRNPVFVQYLAFSVTLRMLLSAYAPFVTVFLRDRDGMHLPASVVIAVNTIGCLGAIATLARWGRWTDRFGAKPTMAVSMAGLATALLLWLFASPVPAWAWAGIPLISLLLGIFTGGLTVSMSKFELAFIPVEGRAHYVAINVTAVGLGSGLATLAGGQLIHELSRVDAHLGWITVDRYRTFFALTAVLLAVPFLARMTLPEDGARSVRRLVRVGLRQARRLRYRLGAQGDAAD